MPNMADILMGKAKEQFPILQDLNIGSAYTPRDDAGYMEFWPPGEPGSSDRPRPSALDAGKPGVEVYRNDATPLDVMGDVTSHYLAKIDPITSAYYSKFAHSLTPQQEQRLQEQYDYARAHDGESRPFGDWKDASGLPAYFRGYPFKQWPEDFNAQAYTPEQRRSLDEMMTYLSRPSLSQILRK